MRNAWLMTNGKLVNNGNIAVADSVTLSAANGVANEAGKLVSASNTLGGGSVIVQNRKGFVENKGVLSADGINYGGSVRVTSPGVMNHDGARISADAHPAAGLGATSNAVGGYVHLKGEQLYNDGIISIAGYLIVGWD